MIVSLIAAMSINRVIGHNGAIPWKIPGEQKRFKEITFGHPIIMGRKSYESIGHPLPGRTNVIMTRQKELSAPGCILVHNLFSALKICKDEKEVFICGGGQIYRLALPVADRIYLTTIHLEIAGDTFFPEFSSTEFKEIKSEFVDETIPYTFSIFERIKNMNH